MERKKNKTHFPSIHPFHTGKHTKPLCRPSFFCFKSFFLCFNSEFEWLLLLRQFPAAPSAFLFLVPVNASIVSSGSATKVFVCQCLLSALVFEGNSWTLHSPLFTDSIKNFFFVGSVPNVVFRSFYCEVFISGFCCLFAGSTKQALCNLFMLFSCVHFIHFRRLHNNNHAVHSWFSLNSIHSSFCVRVEFFKTSREICRLFFVLFFSVRFLSCVFI